MSGTRDLNDCFSAKELIMGNPRSLDECVPHLPVMLNLFKHLDADSLKNISVVSKKWQKFTKNYLQQYKNKIETFDPALHKKLNENNKKINWKYNYKNTK